jgi:hypothetical protein
MRINPPPRPAYCATEAVSRLPEGQRVDTTTALQAIDAVIREKHNADDAERNALAAIACRLRAQGPRPRGAFRMSDFAPLFIGGAASSKVLTPDIAGAKAAQLWRMAQLGLNVSPAFVLPTNAPGARRAFVGWAGFPGSRSPAPGD